MGRRYCFIIMITVLLSCESGVEFKNIPTEKLLSVSAFISPQDTIFRAYLYNARELNSISISDSAVVKDAIVIFSDEHSSDTLLYNDDAGRYEARPKNLTIQSEKTYFLRVLTIHGETLTASCTVPPSPPIPEITGKMSNDDFLFEASWDNPSGYKYFALLTFAGGTYEFEYPWGKRTQQLTARIVDDVSFPADNQNDYNVYTGIVPFANIAQDPKLIVTLRNVDSNLFKYLDTYREYQNWDANNSGSLYPNFQEPLPIFTNIGGGVGIFAGYSQSSAEIDL